MAFEATVLIVCYNCWLFKTVSIASLFRAGSIASPLGLAQLPRPSGRGTRNIKFWLGFSPMMFG
jgi:hypothetical protein